MEIQLRNIMYKYDDGSLGDRNALNGVSLDIQGDRWISIIGHTGSGKSTLAKIIKGLIKPKSGSIKIKRFDDNFSNNSNDIIKEIGFVFQYPEHQLFETTVFKDISFGPKNLGWKNDLINKKVKEVIKWIGLDDSYLEKIPFKLSGGEKRRIAIAGVIIMSPKVLILDEPTAGLDPFGRSLILNLINKWKIKNHSTIIMITHQMNDVLKYSDEVIVMDNGIIKFKETPQVLFSKFENELLQIGLDLPDQVKFINKLNNKLAVKINYNSLNEDDIIRSTLNHFVRRKNIKHE